MERQRKRFSRSVTPAFDVSDQRRWDGARVPNHTGAVFFILRGQVCSGVLTDVRFRQKRCLICLKKKNLFKDVICAVAAAHKVKTQPSP